MEAKTEGWGKRGRTRISQDAPENERRNQKTNRRDGKEGRKERKKYPEKKIETEITK